MNKDGIKKHITPLLILLAIGIVLVVYKSNKPQENVGHDHRNTTYNINNELVTLKNGVAVFDGVPGTSSQTITQYFGNEIQTDLDGDGDKDIAFILTQETGGSGVFYYAVAALNQDGVYMGTDGFLLGDRVAPMTTEVSPNPRHKYVVVFNYADRALNEPMSIKPSVGKSVYLKVDISNMIWGIVEPDFPGESR